MSKKHNNLGGAPISAIKGVVACQLSDAMKKKNLSKGELATLLNPDNDIMLSSPATDGG